MTWKRQSLDKEMLELLFRSILHMLDEHPSKVTEAQSDRLQDFADELREYARVVKSDDTEDKKVLQDFFSATRLHFFDKDLDSRQYDDDLPILSQSNTVPADQANLVSSQVGDNLHMPVIDLDVPIKTVVSSTENHNHLYIDYVMPWENYMRLLTVMSEVGLIQRGWYYQAQRDGRSYVRTIHNKKPEVYDGGE